MRDLEEIKAASESYKAAKALRDKDKANAIFDANPAFAEALLRLRDALSSDDIASISDFAENCPSFLTTPVTLWPNLYEAVQKDSPNMVAALLGVGADPNTSHRTRSVLASAAANANLQIVMLLHEAGAELDTSHIDANPLFATVLSYVKPENRERCLDVAQYLLDAGIDSTVTYKTSRPLPMCAIDFAWMYGARHIARATALHQTGGDETATEALLAEADRKAEINTRGG